jgi:hypothetical protein
MRPDDVTRLRDAAIHENMVGENSTLPPVLEKLPIFRDKVRRFLVYS